MVPFFKSIMIIFRALFYFYLIAVFITAPTLLVVSVEHDAEHNPNQANDESDDTANQSNGGPRLHSQASSIVPAITGCLVMA